MHMKRMYMETCEHKHMSAMRKERANNICEACDSSHGKKCKLCKWCATIDISMNITDAWLCV